MDMGVQCPKHMHVAVILRAVVMWFKRFHLTQNLFPVLQVADDKKDTIGGILQRSQEA